MYQVLLERKAQKALKLISEPYYTQIKKAILNLGDNPRPQGYVKLKGRHGYRIRVADYRIIYDIQDHVLIVEVISIGHRREIYK